MRLQQQVTNAFGVVTTVGLWILVAMFIWMLAGSCALSGATLWNVAWGLWRK